MLSPRFNIYIYIFHLLPLLFHKINQKYTKVKEIIDTSLAICRKGRKMARLICENKANQRPRIWSIVRLIENNPFGHCWATKTCRLSVCIIALMYLEWYSQITTAILLITKWHFQLHSWFFLLIVIYMNLNLAIIPQISLVWQEFHTGGQSYVLAYARMHVCVNYVNNIYIYIILNIPSFYERTM